MTPTTEDDRLLIEAAQADPARFVEIYERYADRVYAFVSRRTRNRAAAEDITSQVFERALAAIGRFEWRGLPVAVWLFRIAANALADHWREQSRQAHEAPPDEPDVSDLEEIERRIVLFQCVRQLPDLQQQVIRMRFVEEKSIREVAAALDRSEGAVKQTPAPCAGELTTEDGWPWLNVLSPIVSTRPSMPSSLVATRRPHCRIPSSRRSCAWPRICVTTRARTSRRGSGPNSNGGRS